MSKKLVRRAGTPPPLDGKSSPTLIVEGRSDAVILRKLLGEKIPTPFRFFASQGRMSLTSLARNVLVHEPDPVVIILDADTATASKAESEQANALESMYPSTRYRVFAFTPSLDKVIEDVVRKEFSESNIPPEKLEQIRAHPQVQRLLDVIFGAGASPSG